MDSLQRGQSMVFVKKSTVFSYVFFLDKKSQKEYYLIFWIEKNRKECFSDHKREVLKNSKKSTFCKGVRSMVFVKKSTFFSFFFLTKKSQKEIFFHILDRKECFLDLKSEVLKNSKKWTVCKGVSPWFLSKNRPFSHMFCFLDKKRQKQTLFDILDSKEENRMRFRPKTKSFKKL